MSIRNKPRRTLHAFILLAPAALSACGGAHNPAIDLSGTQYHPVECAPYARSLTGLELSGEAYQWWDQAQGRYPRSQTPTVGAALVFRQSDLLPHGHVSVVSRLLSSREIMVNQANWVHNRISHDDVVRDVSTGNDWTLVRVWWRPAVSLGITVYPTYGFVGPAEDALISPNGGLQPSGSSAICASSVTAAPARDTG